MLYNVNDSKTSKLIKQFVFWLSLFAMFALFLFIITMESSPQKREVTVEIDIKNKVNICLPEENYKLNSKEIDEFKDN